MNRAPHCLEYPYAQIRAPLHPGEIPRADFREPLGLSINALARALHVPPNHVSGLVNEKRGIGVRMSLRLARDTWAARIEREGLPRAS